MYVLLVLGLHVLLELLAGDLVLAAVLARGHHPALLSLDVGVVPGVHLHDRLLLLLVLLLLRDVEVRGRGGRGHHPRDGDGGGVGRGGQPQGRHAEAGVGSGLNPRHLGGGGGGGGAGPLWLIVLVTSEAILTAGLLLLPRIVPSSASITARIRQTLEIEARYYTRL